MLSIGDRVIVNLDNSKMDTIVDTIYFNKEQRYKFNHRVTEVVDVIQLRNGKIAYKLRLNKNYHWLRENLLKVNTETLYINYEGIELTKKFNDLEKGQKLKFKDWNIGEIEFQAYPEAIATGVISEEDLETLRFKVL